MTAGRTAGEKPLEWRSVRDADGFVALFAADAVAAIPLPLPGFPVVTAGREELRQAIAESGIDAIGLPDLRVLRRRRLESPNHSLIYVEGHLVLRAGNRTYRTDYMATAMLRGGEISWLALDITSPEAAEDTQGAVAYPVF
ncbi:nuclear transport factor 2 family protein [Nocardia transvalensis]|uniref:nuclear transport factor 2 family protein n=1 Tax=Nocardia transvalensis TaxID=37333 RepID=UPI001893D006|nr:nuclear transport factor 2 family protein [Nocardia transvalensis]MBF6333878.1 nuclear transport factor 2 family protein [Nocardia transvalensis]